jgi:hypothetical protein
MVSTEESMKSQQMLTSYSEDKQKILKSTLKTFQRTYPHIFGSQFLSEEEIQSWGKLWGRVTEDLSEKQMQLALKKSVFLSKYPPSPAQFREYAFDLPSPIAAFALAIDFIVNKLPVTNEIVYECAKKIPSFDWSNLSEKDLKAKFISIYERVSEKYLLGNSANG